MAQGGLSGQGWCPEVGEGGEAVLGQIWKPQALAWPGRKWQDESKIDDMDRHLSARARLHRLVRALCLKYRKEFPAYKYRASSEESGRETALLLSRYGGLPDTGGQLNGVPAEVLEKAVEAFARYFGLESPQGGETRQHRVEAAGGNLPGSGSFPAMVDPQPRTRVDMEVPW